MLTIISTALYMLMLLFFSGSYHFLGKLDLFAEHRFLSCFVGGIILAIVTTVCIMLFSKDTKGQNEILSEFEENGYSDRYISLLQSEVRRHSIEYRSNNHKNNINYIECLERLADAYLFKEQVNEAMSTLNLINPEMRSWMAANNNLFVKKQLSGYYDVQMCICEELRDVQRANNVMREGSLYVSKAGIDHSALDLVNCEVLCTYNIVIGNYNTAMQYASFCLQAKNPAHQFTGNLLMSKVYYYIGDFESAKRYRDAAASIGFKREKAKQDLIAYFDKKYLGSM